jgi:hypothetical protein
MQNSTLYIFLLVIGIVTSITSFVCLVAGIQKIRNKHAKSGFEDIFLSVAYAGVTGFLVDCYFYFF